MLTFLIGQRWLRRRARDVAGQKAAPAYEARLVPVLRENHAKLADVLAAAGLAERKLDFVAVRIHMREFHRRFEDNLLRENTRLYPALLSAGATRNLVHLRDSMTALGKRLLDAARELEHAPDGAQFAYELGIISRLFARRREIVERDLYPQYQQRAASAEQRARERDRARSRRSRYSLSDAVTTTVY